MIQFLFNSPAGDSPYRIDWNPENAGMEQVPNPTNSNYRLEIDGSAQPIASIVWTTATRMTVSSPAPNASVDGKLIQINPDPGSINTDGIAAAPPNSTAGIP